MDEHGLAGRRARAAARRGGAAEAALHDPRPPEPGGREHVDGTPRAARRARAAARVPDRRGRRVPRARVRGRLTAEPLEPRARRRRPARDDVEDVLPRRAARVGRRSGGDLRAARQREAEHRPVRRRARAAALRGVRAPRLDRGAARAVARALPAQVRAHARRARSVDAFRHFVDDPARRVLLVAHASRRRRLGRPRAACGREGRRNRPGRALLRRRKRRGQGAPVVQHGRRAADRRGDRAARARSCARPAHSFGGHAPASTGRPLATLVRADREAMCFAMYSASLPRPGSTSDESEYWKTNPRKYSPGSDSTTPR